jgi:hypothetical protein
LRDASDVIGLALVPAWWAMGVQVAGRRDRRRVVTSIDEEDRVRSLYRGRVATVGASGGARRDFDAEYQAVVSSTYVFDGDEWKLRVHQQTPV